MKIAFKVTKFKQEALVQIAYCNSVIEEYQRQGMRLTLRQLYYQLVTKNIIKNEEKSYSYLSSLISRGRLSGLIDWDAIEDRVRQPRIQSEFDDLSELVEAAINSYRLPRWEGQEYYAELWVEKDALAGVLAPIAREFHVTMMVNRGYSSQSAMFESAKRFAAREKQKPLLFYLGDHDPSGEDMVRDIEDRLIMFGIFFIEVRKLALTMEQVEEFDPPPNPAKIKDPRAMEYIRKYGSSSWEVDALPPRTLTEIIQNAFIEVIDKPKMDKVLKREKAGIKRLRAVVVK